MKDLHRIGNNHTHAANSHAGQGAVTQRIRANLHTVVAMRSCGQHARKSGHAPTHSNVHTCASGPSCVWDINPLSPNQVDAPKNTFGLPNLPSCNITATTYVLTYDCGARGQNRVRGSNLRARMKSGTLSSNLRLRLRSMGSNTWTRFCQRSNVLLHVAIDLPR